MYASTHLLGKRLKILLHWSQGHLQEPDIKFSRITTFQEIPKKEKGQIGNSLKLIDKVQCLLQLDFSLHCKDKNKTESQDGWVNHLDESSSTGINGEAAWAGDTGESVVVLTFAGELQEDPALLLFPSRVSEDTHTPGSDSCATSEESMLVMPWKNLFGWYSVSISHFLFNGPRTLGLMQLMGLWLLRVVNRVVGLGIGLGGNPLLLTKLCKDGEKHCFPIPRVGDGAGDTGMKSMRFGEADFSTSLSLRLKLSSQEWLICIAFCTSRSWTVSRLIKSMPSSCLIWCKRLLCMRTGEAGSSRPWRFGNVVLFRLALGASAWNTGEVSLRPWMRGALLDLLRPPPPPLPPPSAGLPPVPGGSSRSSSIFSWAMSGAGRRGRCSVRDLGFPFPAIQGRRRHHRHRESVSGLVPCACVSLCAGALSCLSSQRLLNA